MMMDKTDFGQQTEYTTENGKCHVRERFLQIIWNERLLAPELRCTDGARLELITTGTWNDTAGPDFRQAVLRLDGSELHGDVEVHRRASDWWLHHHQDNPDYRRVILHVVWEDDCPARPPLPGLRTLELRRNIPESWQSLLDRVEAAFYPYARMQPPGGCAVRWLLANDTQIQAVLTEAALGRLSLKGRRLMERAAETDQDQAVYEAVFEALGYRWNREPFRQLAMQTPLAFLTGFPDAETRRAILRGRAGVLPDLTKETALPVFEAEIRRSWQLWWQVDGQRLELPWHNAAVRPYNSRVRRLEAGLAWLEETGYHPAVWLRRNMRRDITPKELTRRLLDFPAGRPAWQEARDYCHRIKPPAALLGEARARDIAMNVILPFLHELAGRPAGQPEMAETIRELYLTLCPGQDNVLLRRAVQRFFIPPSRAKTLLKRACHQQGLLAIYQNFCLALDCDCRSCPFHVNSQATPTGPESLSSRP